ncbi:hypothetical protein [Sphingobium phenoxybenzoativorans]|nr:hypothetical protein [Sphingobium phenoxybenzoativorans]
MNRRDLPPSLAAEILAPTLQPFLALRIEFPDPVYAFTGKGAMSFASVDGAMRQWLGIHGVASIGAATESTDGSAQGIEATLFQIPSEFRNDIADQAVRGCLYELYLGAFAPDFQTVRAVKRIWKGTLQSYVIDDLGESITVTAGGESRAIDQKRPSIKRFTDEYHRRKYANDKFFEYAPKLTEVPLLWAKQKQDPVV